MSKLKNTFRERLVKDILSRKDINSNIQIVTSTTMNISFDELTRRLSLLNSQVNRKLFRYYYKFPEKKVMFICNHERVRDNVHSHVTLRIPRPSSFKDQSKYDPINVVLLMKQIWEQENPKYRLYFDFNIKNLVGKVIYDFKKFYNRRPEVDDTRHENFAII